MSLTRRLLAILLWGVAALSLLILVLVVTINLLPTQRLLKDFVVSSARTATGCDVQIKDFSLSPFSSLTIEGLTVGDGDRVVLSIPHLATRWSLRGILSRRFTLGPLDVEDVAVGLFQNKDGSFLCLPKADAAAAAAPPAEPTSPFSFNPPTIPVDIRLQDIHASLRSLRVETQNMKAEGHGLAVAIQGRLFNQEIELGVRTTIATGGQPWRAVLPEGVVDWSPETTLQIDLDGWHDVAIVLTHRSVASLQRTNSKIALPFDVDAELRVDPIDQHLAVRRFDVVLGELASFNAALALRGFSFPPAEVSVDRCEGRLDLPATAPWLASADVPLSLDGSVVFHVRPFVWGGSAEALPNALARLQWLRGGVKGFGTTITGLVHETLVALEEGSLSLSSKTEAASMLHPTATVRSLALVLKTDRLDLKDLIEARPVDLPAELSMNLQRASLPGAQTTARDLQLVYTTVVPLPWILRPERAQVWKQRVSAAWRTVQNKQATLSRGEALAVASINLPVGGVHALLESPLSTDPSIHFTLSSGASVHTTNPPAVIHPISISSEFQLASERARAKVEMGLGALAQFALDAKIDDMRSAAPRIHQTTASVVLPHLDALTSFVPEGVRSDVDLSGRASGKAVFSGVLPYRRLLGSDLPRLTAAIRTGPAEGWTAWKRFQKHIGLKTSGTVELTNLAGRFRESALSHAEVEVDWRLDRKRWMAATSIKGDAAFGGHRVTGLSLTTEFALDRDGLVLSQETAFREAALAGLARSISGSSTMLGQVAPEKEMAFAIKAQVPELGFNTQATVGVLQPFQVLRASTDPDALAAILDVKSSGTIEVDAGEGMTLTEGALAVNGRLDAGWSVNLNAGRLLAEAALAADGFGVQLGDLSVVGLSGKLPLTLAMKRGREEGGLVLEGVPEPFGPVTILAGDAGAYRSSRFPALVPKLKAYRERKGLYLKEAKRGELGVEELTLDAAWNGAELLLSEFSCRLLGGDIRGQGALSIKADRSLHGDLEVQVSNIDASNFSDLELEPGPESEMNADMRFGFSFEEKQRDVRMAMNVTRIGDKTLDRFLLLLDPEKKEASIQSARSNLGWIRINRVAVWSVYENLNMDLDYRTFLRVPFTDIAWKPVPRELLRRYSLTGLFDIHLQPVVNRTVGRVLGWRIQGGES